MKVVDGCGGYLFWRCCCCMWERRGLTITSNVTFKAEVDSAEVVRKIIFHLEKLNGEIFVSELQRQKPRMWQRRRGWLRRRRTRRCRRCWKRRRRPWPSEGWEIGGERRFGTGTRHIHFKLRHPRLCTAATPSSSCQVLLNFPISIM